METLGFCNNRTRKECLFCVEMNFIASGSPELVLEPVNKIFSDTMLFIIDK